MRGARTGGLRESNSMLFEMGKPQFLYPDTDAGIEEDTRNCNQKKLTFFSKPPNKRPNYNKFKIVSPFLCNWKLLLKDWDSNFTGNFSVIRDRRVLNLIEVIISNIKESFFYLVLADFSKHQNAVGTNISQKLSNSC